MTQTTSTSPEAIDLDTFLARLAAYVNAQRRGDPCVAQIAGDVLVDSRCQPRTTIRDAVEHRMDRVHSGVAEMWEWQAAQKVWLLINEHSGSPLIGEAIEVYARSILPMDSDGTEAYGANREAARELYGEHWNGSRCLPSGRTFKMTFTSASTATPEMLELAARRLARDWLCYMADVLEELEDSHPNEEDWDRELRPAELLAWSRVHDLARTEGLDPVDAAFPDPLMVPEWCDSLNRSTPTEAEVGSELREIGHCLRGQYILAEREVYLDNRFSGGLDMSGRPSEEHGYITRQMRWLDRALQAHARKETEGR